MPFLSATNRASVAGLQLLARQIVEGYYSGLHRSPHKGFSVEFKEHRAYTPGDDIRTIDWKLFGKTDRYFIREYEEETNLRCTVLVDGSGSMGYRGSRSDLSKHDFAVQVAASLAYLLIGQQDAVGLATFDTDVRRYIPPRSQSKHLKVLLEELAGSRPGGETELADTLRKVAGKISRRGLVVVLSDLFGDAEATLRSLARFRHANHEVVLFQVFDPDELDFPFDRWTQFDSLEKADHRHLVDPTQMRQQYLARLDAFRTQLVAGCSRQRISLVPLRTDRSPADALAAYLAMRRRTP